MTELRIGRIRRFTMARRYIATVSVSEEPTKYSKVFTYQSEIEEVFIRHVLDVFQSKSPFCL